MSLADELLKLEQLRSSEALTAREYEDAKRTLLYPPAAPTAPAVASAVRVASVPPPMSSGLDRSATEYFERHNRADRNRMAWNIIVGIAILIGVIIAISAFSASSGSDPDPGSSQLCYYGNNTVICP